MASIFSKIIAGEIPCHKVAENEDFIAFLDINPNAAGHTLCVPKKEVDKIFDLDADTYQALMKFSYAVAKGMEQAVVCKRVGMAVVGLEVPHVHVHLIPLQEMDDFRFSKKVQLTDQEFKDTAAQIAAHVKF